MAAIDFTQRPTQEAFTSIANAFNDPTTFSDIKIVCNGQEWHCHKLIPSRRSEWFRRAFAGDFQESRAGAIELHEDISDVAILVRAMLQYCYTSTCPIVANPQIHPILFRIRMFALGEKYFVQGLCEVSSHGLDLMLKATSNSIPLTSDTFLQAIREAYTLIKDPQRHVRDILITHVVNSSRRTQITRGSQYRDLMQELPDFAIDLTMALVEKSIPHTEVTTRLSPPQMLLILQPHNWEDLVDPHILSGPCRYNCPDGCGDVFTASMGGSSSGNWHHSCQVMDTFHHMSFQRWAEEFLVDEGT